MNIEVFTPEAKHSPEELESRYPPRQLSSKACVTRFGPSPTGFLHIGGLYTSLISKRLAKQTGGVFFLRIEDTDKKREMKGAVELIISSLQAFELSPDEGEIAPGIEVGRFGPYRQSERKELYQSFVRRLLQQDNAYPCFATSEELQRSRDEQVLLKIPPGYYGRWALWRNRPAEEAEAAFAAHKPFVVRLKAPSDQPERVVLPDNIRGELTLKPNEQDVVLLKADGMPTYHLAHVVDDRLMGTTDVIRGHEWLSSYPLHVQLFAMLGWTPPRYAHISPIEKMDGSSRRKLSKRHDPEASVGYYMEQGYPYDSVIEYLLTLVDGRFEDWRRDHPDEDLTEFSIDLGRMSRSGALFDRVKLDSISRDQIARMSAAAVYEAVSTWAYVYAPDFAAMIDADAAYSIAILGIERQSEQVRKDIARWADLTTDIAYFFDNSYARMVPRAQKLLAALEPTAPAAMLLEIGDGYDPGLGRDSWLEWIRETGARYCYARSKKIFQQNPSEYHGHLGDLTAAIRIVLAARATSPDLYVIMQVMNQDRVRSRLRAAADW